MRKFFSASLYPVQLVDEKCLYRRVALLFQAFSHHYYQVYPGTQAILIASENLPGQPFGPVSFNRLTYFPGCTDTQPSDGVFRFHPVDDEITAYNLLPLAINPLELVILPDPLFFTQGIWSHPLPGARGLARSMVYTVSRFLPLALLLCRTFLPPLLLILAMKP